MKRIRMLTLLGMLAVVLPIGLLQGVAQANDEGGSPNQVTIHQYASYILAGASIDVGLDVKCQGGSGDVVVDVTQSPPQTPYPVGAGSGPQIVVCDGHTHSVAVTITGFGFDAGTARATADLTTTSSPAGAAPCPAVDHHRCRERIIPGDKAAAGDARRCFSFDHPGLPRYPLM